MQFDYFTLTLLLGGFTALLSGLLVMIHDHKNTENQTWLMLNLSSAVWSFGYFAMTISTDSSSAYIYNVILHAAAILIPLFYFLFTLTATSTFLSHKKVFYTSVALAFIFEVFNATTYFVKDVVPKAPFKFAPEPGPLYIYFTIYFFAIVLYSIYIEYKRYKNTEDKIRKQTLKYIILFTLAGFGGGGSVFLLTFNIPLAPYPLILFSLYPAISGYTIFRYQLFNIRVIGAQFLTFALWIFIFIRLVLSNSSQERYLNIVFLSITIIIGLLLIKSVIKEVKNREHTEQLAHELEVVNVRLKELDQQKSEFVSLASHQLRGPLTAIKGYGSMLLDGDFGEMKPEVKDAVEKIYKSTQDLVVLVGDYLDVSRIEQGRMQYDFTIFDFKNLASTVVESLKPTLEQAHLTIDFNYNDQIDYQINADQGKIKQVIGNIVDNAIKYTPRGGLHVWLTQSKAKKVLLTITDTGVGIQRDVLPRLFEKFTRAPDASKTNIMGTGLGLYVAKKIVEAHNGRIWAESAGPGKGSTFFIELDSIN